jgi:hypothetical protein
MVYDIQDYWVLGLCPSSGILKNRTQRFGNWICFRPQVRGQETYPVSETLCSSVF